MTKFKFFLMLLAASSLLITSCGSDDEDITGTYKIVSYGSSSCDDPALNIILDVSSDDGCSSIAGQEVCGDGTFMINSDNTFSVSFTFSGLGITSSTSGSGSYTISGNTITICDEDLCLDGNISGNRLTLSFPGEDGCELTIIGEKQ